MEIIIKLDPKELTALDTLMRGYPGETNSEPDDVMAHLIRNGVTVNYLIDGNLIRSSLEGKGEKK